LRSTSGRADITHACSSITGLKHDAQPGLQYVLT
jgi:hypothetical protein